VQELDEQATGAPEQRRQQQKSNGSPTGSVHCRHFRSYACLTAGSCTRRYCIPRRRSRG
jgi:hypothetical protein